MDLIENILLENIDKPNSLFIFPTDIAASRWADHLLRLRGGTVAMGKFTAWDIFKQNSIKSKVQDKKSIPSALRKIFISRLLKENAAACEQENARLFTSLIRPEWAGEAAQFTQWLTRLLPQLASWFNKTTNLAITSIFDGSTENTQIVKGFEGDDRDMYNLAKHYALFLNEHNLFEPAWETPPFNNDGRECFLFFPESLSDYSEYKELLETSNHVTIVRTGCAEKLPSDTFFYTNSRSEITEAALYIRALHEKQGIAWDSIALCIPDSENYEPYVLREFTNRNIPFVKRASKPLAEYQAGRFFKSINNCISQDFAFSALASLVLNRNLPWKDTAIIDSLMEFGIKNNCISSWTEEKNGKKQNVNVWEDAFSQPYGGIDKTALNFYYELKKRASSLRAAGSFAEVRRQYFTFREYFFDMDICSEESDLVLSRAISELTNLCEIEKSFPQVPAVDPFLFFTEHLNEVKYLAQAKTSGVNILPYKTAASVPFDCHIILSACHKDLSVVYNRLDFLPRNKREKLGIFDEDASGAFIEMHKFNSVKKSAFFCSEQTFSGFTIPHAKINAPSKPKNRYADEPEISELFSHDLYKTENPFVGNSQVKLHENQIKGFNNWKERRFLSENNDGKWQINKPILDLIHKKYAQRKEFPGKFSVSDASLQPYFQCSLKWLYERVLNLDNVEIEASLMAENISGTVYHNALNKFFLYVKEKKEPLALPVLTKQGLSLSDDYLSSLENIINDIFMEFPLLGEDGKTQMSSLTSRLLRAGKKQFLFHLENCLVKFLSLFAGCFVVESETNYHFECKNYFLNGKLDCILEDRSEDESKYIIVDFKLKRTPKRKDCSGDGENALANFQLPMYITLVEENENIKVHTALFYSILELKPTVLIGTTEDKFTNKVSPFFKKDQILIDSDKYNQILEEFIQKTNLFADEIETGNFSVFETKFHKCNECKYRRICRTVYTIDRSKNISMETR
jgi:hypothetical protein